ncbi:hypothetical protein SDC9_139288 [bioreactor metagenome]|uniref:Uncharacterized protein n=1 Tax=bioreactor metagenome TaxID=1076179 RepID=A0A645DU83_9ZZZZ
MIASALHRQRQLVRPAERRDKQRNQNRHQRLGPVNQPAGLHIRTTRLLCRHNLIRLFYQRWNKTQCNRHHHGQLMHWYTQLFQRRKQSLNRISERNGRGGVGQQRCTRNQADDAYHHQHRQQHALTRNFDDPKLKNRRALDKNHVEHGGEQNDRHHRLKAVFNHHERNAGNQVTGQSQSSTKQQPRHITGEK